MEDARERYGKKEIKKLSVLLKELSLEVGPRRYDHPKFAAFFEDDQDTSHKYSSCLLNFQMSPEYFTYERIIANKDSSERLFETIVYIMELPFDQLPLMMHNTNRYLIEVCKWRLKQGS